MKRLMCMVLALALALSAQPLSAQTPDLKLKRFRVLLTSGDRYEGTDAILTSETLTGTIEGDSAISVPVEEILDLDGSNSSRALRGTMIGAGLGVLCAAGAVGAYYAGGGWTSEDAEEKTALFVVGSAAAGGLIGFIVGSRIKLWDDIPLETAFQYDPEGNRAEFVLSFSF
ncbi:MAG: hypothetical protein JSV52_12105 [Candidatus Zixiibacteriota bacterium]|nr:MAG: hypothetical protein JSV52_12105 [candidate division Zixibacteria bacterium]